MGRGCARLKDGFTLVELLVVIAITAVTAALLLAAVMKARESANRTICAHNLRQLALAAQAYQSQFDALPPNFDEDPARTDGSHNLFYGPIVRLLPFLELNSSYQNFSFLYYDSTFPDPRNYGWPAVPGGMTWQRHSWYPNPFNAPLPAGASAAALPPSPLLCPNPTGLTGIAGQTWGGEGTFRVFRCPSQPMEHFSDQRGSVVIYSYDGIPGIDFPAGNPLSWDPSTPECHDSNSSPAGPACKGSVIAGGLSHFVLGRSDYVAVAGLFVDVGSGEPEFTLQGAQKYRSLFGWNTNASLIRVPDGTSNTLLFSEYAGFPAMNAPTGVTGWVSASWMTNAITVARGTCPDPNNKTCDFSPEGSKLGGGNALGGWHNGLFYVAFADGSVRPLKVGLASQVLRSLAGYNDGDIVPDSF
jgi:prepilin-type N-terminal cleavage/methylation domain-containing protein/prepilin-type processing-associated H-X9-DG protein